MRGAGSSQKGEAQTQDPGPICFVVGTVLLGTLSDKQKRDCQTSLPDNEGCKVLVQRALLPGTSCSQEVLLRSSSHHECTWNSHISCMNEGPQPIHIHGQKSKSIVMRKQWTQEFCLYCEGQVFVNLRKMVSWLKTLSVEPLLKTFKHVCGNSYTLLWQAPQL